MKKRVLLINSSLFIERLNTTPFEDPKPSNVHEDPK